MHIPRHFLLMMVIYIPNVTAYTLVMLGPSGNGRKSHLKSAKITFFEKCCFWPILWQPVNSMFNSIYIFLLQTCWYGVDWAINNIFHILVVFIIEIKTLKNSKFHHWKMGSTIFHETNGTPTKVSLTGRGFVKIENGFQFLGREWPLSNNINLTQNPFLTTAPLFRGLPLNWPSETWQHSSSWTHDTVV